MLAKFVEEFIKMNEMESIIFQIWIEME